ncbi:hypothetical protein CLV78_101708 [Aliiruegeria haliotis]|uniref:Uncharacterized protein n=1 Tax=Aliiruegeria haliotis TaxID=1280846 RepID=A0A2T0RZJ9_9RHOB|nr:hypothetical protein [Aliiruegeria haliotis]PRY26608.1 hypothetical protein CLV78_101708 [Aliiruegeria haliotis]
MPSLKCLVSVAALFGATVTFAQPYASKGEVAGWRIFVNEANSSCFMEIVTDEGLVMQMGTGGKVDMGYLGLYTEGETGIRDGETGEIRIGLGGLVYNGVAQGVQRDGYSGGYFIGNNPLMGFDLSTQSEMVVNPGSGREFTVDLSGAGEAMEATRACQMELAE